MIVGAGLKPASTEGYVNNLGVFYRKGSGSTRREANSRIILNQCRLLVVSAQEILGSFLRSVGFEYPNDFFRWISFYLNRTGLY
jgi:hypothetical protein